MFLKPLRKIVIVNRKDDAYKNHMYHESLKKAIEAN